MRKSLSFLAAFVFTCVSYKIGEARLIGANPTGSSADVMCNGGRIAGNTVLAYTEVCQDSNGDILPTSLSNTSTLGTAALPWLNIYAAGQTISGSLTVQSAAYLATNSTPSALIPVSVACGVPLANAQFQVGSNNTAFTVNKNGWIEVKNTAPAISSCGSSPSVASGNDMVGDVTLGSSAVTTCTVTFANAPTNIPSCVATNRTSKISVVAQPTATTMVIVGSGAGAFGNTNDVIDWICLGYR